MAINWEIPWRHTDRHPLLERSCKPGHQEGQQHSVIHPKEHVQLPEAYQSTELLDHGQWSSQYWSTHPYTQTNINKLDAVQRHAVTGDYRTTSSVSERITNLRWETLLQRRTQAKLVMMCRITNSFFVDIQAPQPLHPAALNTI